MPEDNHLKVLEATFEKLRCSLCTGYLSCAPIRLLPDGNNICGYCSPNDDVLPYRQLTLEAILTETEFPCKFKDFGCPTRLKFGHGTNHEEVCNFRLFNCNSSSPCDWQGPFMTIPEHYEKEHCALVKQAPEILINIEENVKDTMMVKESNKPSVYITYEYDKDTFNLRYSVHYFLANVTEATHKIRLINLEDLDYVMQVKGGECFGFDTFKSKEAMNLNVNKYLDVLNDPEDIKIVFDATIKSDDEISGLTVDYGVLEQIRCSTCQYYLIPPIYYLRPNIVCGDCYNISPEVGPPARNWRINDLISLANYPCRWPKCNFVGKSGAIRAHESNCKFRKYRCLIFDCKVLLNLNEVVEHFEDHGCMVYEEGTTIAYTTDLTDPMEEQEILAFLDKEMVAITCTVKEVTSMENAHHISIQTSAFNPKQFRGEAQFGHDHCKFKSKKFLFHDIVTVRLSELPRCFENDDEITVYFKIE